MIVAAAAAFLTVGLILYTLSVRPQDLPAAPPESPFKHLDERKAAIYDNLRDLQFEYRVGKLSEQDYQQTKLDLQRELASVLAEVDRLKAELGVEAASVAVKPAERQKAADGRVCPHCGAKFAQPLKFCGECGKPMAGQQSS
jgi:rRNA maturation endonuclease Nob1